MYRGYASYKHPEYNYISSYEKVAEFDILLLCLETFNTSILSQKEKGKKIGEENIQKIYDLFNSLMHEIVRAKSNIDACKYVSLIKAIRKTRQKYNDVVPDYFDKVFKTTIRA